MEIFYDVLKNSDEDKLNLISNEIYKMNRHNNDYWEFIIQNSILDSEIILSNLDNFNIEFLISKQKLKDTVLSDNNFLSIISEKKLYDNIIKDQNLSISTLELYVDKYENISWENICKYQNLTIEFMEKYINKLIWNIISESQFMSYEFINKYKDYICWDLIGQNIKLEFLFNDSFVEIFSENNIWDILIWSNNISEEFLKKNIDKLNYKQTADLLEYKKLNEDIINIILKKKNDNTKFYKIIAENQDLSNEFIQNNLEKLDINDIIENQNIDFNFIKYNVKNIRKLSYNDNLSEELLLKIYEIKDDFEDTLDWDFISEHGYLTEESISKITELNKDLLLENYNIKL